MAASSSPAASAKPTGTKVVVSYSELSPADVQMWIAQKAGYFAKNGLNVDMRFIASSTGVAAIISGGTRIAQLGGSEAVAADVGGAHLVITATLTPVFPYTFLVAPNIKTKQDLLGKKVGVSKVGSSSDTALRAALSKEGIVPNKDVSVVSVGSRAAQTAAALSGGVQGELSHPPDSLTLESHGWHVLFDLTSLGLQAANNTVVANKSWLDSHRSVMQKYIDSIVEAEARAKADRAYTYGVLRQYLKAKSQKALQESYDFYVGKALPVLPYPKASQFTTVIEQLSQRNAKAKGFNVAPLLDPSFVQSAASRGLDKLP